MAQKVQINQIGKEDAYHYMRQDLIGLTGTFDFGYPWGGGWYGGSFQSDEAVEHYGAPKQEWVFHKIRVKRLPEN